MKIWQKFCKIRFKKFAWKGQKQNKKMFSAPKTSSIKERKEFEKKGWEKTSNTKAYTYIIHG